MQNSLGMPGTRIFMDKVPASVHRSLSKLASIFACFIACFGSSYFKLPAMAAPAEIRGKVLESDILNPIAGADLLVFPAVPQGGVVTRASYSDEKVLGRSQTGADGSFRLIVDQPGRYRVQAKKEGYRESGPMNRGTTSAVTVVVEGEDAVEGIRLLLARPGEIQGLLVDEQSGAALSGQSVVALQSFYVAGERRFMPSGFGLTNEKGEITIRELTPADYVVRVRLHPFGAERIVRKFSEEDAERVDTGFAQPGLDIGLSSPITVRSGDQVYVGAIALRPASFYRARFSFPPGACMQDALVNVAIANTADGAYETTADLPCSEPFLVKGLAPGSYHAVTYLRDQDRESQRRGSLNFEVIDRNLVLELPLVKGVDVKGRIVLPGGATKTVPEGVRVQMQSVGSVLRREDLEEIPINPEGEFHVANVAAGEKQLKLIGLPQNYYVQQVRYNGQPVPASQLRLDPAQLSQDLEVTIANDTASIWGTVKDGDKLRGQFYVVAVPSGEARGRSLYPLRGVEGNTKGEYRIDGLPPGDYHVMAVASEMKPDLEDPQTLAAVLRDAQKVAIAPNGTQIMNLPSVRHR